MITLGPIDIGSFLCYTIFIVNKKREMKMRKIFKEGIKIDKITDTNDLEKMADNIVNRMIELGLFQDKSEPGYQVLQLYEAGEDLDKYHWENYIWNFGKGPFVGVKLVKNQFADAIMVTIPDFTEQELSEIVKHHDTDEIMRIFGYERKNKNVGIS